MNARASTRFHEADLARFDARASNRFHDAEVEGEMRDVGSWR